MLYLQVFVIGFIASFVGSIPPGTLNLCVLQLGLEQKVKTALRFSLAVAIIEYPYAWIAVVFEDLITSTPAVTQNFQLLTAVVMLLIGLLTLWSANQPTSFASKFSHSGFRRGIVLSILNPMAIPYWIGVTAYFKAQGWISLQDTGLLHAYVFGTSAGAMALLTLFTLLANRLAYYVKDNKWVKRTPGIVLLLLGAYALIKYLAG